MSKRIYGTGSKLKSPVRIISAVLKAVRSFRAVSPNTDWTVKDTKQLRAARKHAATNSFFSLFCTMTKDSADILSERWQVTLWKVPTVLPVD